MALSCVAAIGKRDKAAASLVEGYSQLLGRFANQTLPPSVRFADSAVVRGGSCDLFQFDYEANIFLPARRVDAEDVEFLFTRPEMRQPASELVSTVDVLGGLAINTASSLKQGVCAYWLSERPDAFGNVVIVVELLNAAAVATLLRRRYPAAHGCLLRFPDHAADAELLVGCPESWERRVAVSRSNTSLTERCLAAAVLDIPFARAVKDKCVVDLPFSALAVRENCKSCCSDLSALMGDGDWEVWAAAADPHVYVLVVPHFDDGNVQWSWTSQGARTPSCEQVNGADENEQSDVHARDRCRTQPVGRSQQCPNCGRSFDDRGVSVPFTAITKYAQKTSRSARRELETLMPPTVAPLPRKCRDGRTVLLPKPTSVRCASDVEVVAALDKSSACFQRGHKWADLPPVLRRLNVPLEELGSRAVWHDRSITLCQGCALMFGVASVQPEQQATVQRVHEDPPLCTKSEVIDQIVLSDLQAQHRKSRRAERAKFEMRQVVQQCRDSIASPSAEVRDSAFAETLLDGFCCDDAPITADDAPPSLSLCNELFASMSKACAVPPEPELGAVVSRLKKSGGSNEIPRPPVQVQTTQTSDAASTGDTNTAYGTLARQSFTFSQLRRAEQRLIVRFVGADKQHVSATSDDAAET